MTDLMAERVGSGRPLRVGDLVEIRPRAEIVATLDDNGRLDGMPFMPEMTAYCGQRATVVKSAHKTCDGHGNIRWLDDTVHLEGLHCDGSAHGGCQARCLMFWKEAWLKRVARNDDKPELLTSTAEEPSLERHGSTTYEASDGTLRYMCQATEVNAASRPLPVGELKQYLWDVHSGNVTLRDFVRVMAKMVFNRYQRWTTEHLPPALRINGGHRLHHVQGRQSRSPTALLDLEVGDRVRIRPRDQIESTLNRSNGNRGLLFDSEDATWCGTSSTVTDRIKRFVDDQTGRMIEMKSDCIMLDGVVCRGEYWRMCSRSLPTYFREIWLERQS